TGPRVDVSGTAGADPTWLVGAPVAGSTVVPVGSVGPSAAGDTDSACAMAGAPPVNIVAPTAAATRTRRSRIFAAPPPLGCTRFVSSTRYTLVVGSIITEVPVKPVWITDSAGKNGMSERA